MDSRRRKILKKFFVDEKENDIIKKKIEKAHKNNFSDYAREMFINGEIKLIDFTLIKEIRYEVNRIGNNINQIVKLANENRSVREGDIEQILKNQIELEEKIYKIINKELKKSCKK